jgi:uncharacterized protein YjbI with pentapeptide repeats
VNAALLYSLNDMTKKELINRWDRPLNSEDLSKSAFGTYSEKTDFRGITFGRPLRNFSVSDADFSYSSLKSGQFSFAEFSYCNFSFCNLEGTVIGNFNGCQFNKSKLNVTISTGEFKECVFNLTLFKKSSASLRVEFVDCVFIDCDLSHVQFIESNFKECSFKGGKSGYWASFCGSKFKSCTFENFDFKGAILDEVEFIECVGK